MKSCDNSQTMNNYITMETLPTSFVQKLPSPVLLLLLPSLPHTLVSNTGKCRDPAFASLHVCILTWPLVSQHCDLVIRAQQSKHEYA